MSTAEAYITDELVPDEEAPRRRSKVPGLLLLTLLCLILMGIALGTLSTRQDAVPRSPHSAQSSPAPVVATP